jgi:succinoglycan biosynthesis transport protein ExoP
MTETEPSVDLRDYADILRRQRWLILAFAALGLIGSALRVTLSTPVYTSTAEVLVRPISAASPTGDGEVNLETEREVAVSTAVARLAKREMGASARPEALLEHVTVEIPPETEVLQIIFSDPDPATARTGAAAFASAYLEFRTRQALEALLSLSQRLQERISEYEAQISAANEEIAGATPGSPEQRDAQVRRDLLVSQLSVIQNQLAAVNSQTVDPGQIIGRPTVPTSPSSPNVPVNLALGLFFGVFTGAAIGLVRDRLDDRLRGPREVEQTAGTPVLAVLPKAQADKEEDSPLSLLAEPNGLSSEGYRRLRGAVQLLSRNRALRTLMVTSPLEEEGKTTTAVNLAVAFAQAGRQVILISADLRRPKLHDFFGLENDEGLTDVLAGERSLSEVVRAPGIDNLGVIPSGRIPAHTRELLDQDAVASLMRDLRRGAELVILDTPPVLAVADAVLLAPHVDAVLLVAREGKTRAAAILQARDDLERAGTTMLGCVLTGHRPVRGGAYEYTALEEPSRDGALSRLMTSARRRWKDRSRSWQRPVV